MMRALVGKRRVAKGVWTTSEQTPTEIEQVVKHGRLQASEEDPALRRAAGASRRSKKGEPDSSGLATSGLSR